MNPLKHFGIKNIMIRGDTKSYNKDNGTTCNLCGGTGLHGYLPNGTPNPNYKGPVTICTWCNGTGIIMKKDIQSLIDAQK